MNVLSLIPGDAVGGGSAELPPADESQAGQPTRSVVLAVAELGAVRITYTLKSYRHGRRKFWHWVATHAERLDRPSPTAAAPHET